MAGQLSEAEIDALLREPIIARLATIDEDGSPYIVPVWTWWDGERLYLVARAKAAFVAHVRLRPRIALSVVRDDAAGTRALIRGEARIVAGPGPLTGHMLEIARDMAERYEGDAGADYIAESTRWPRVLIEITPQQIVTWGDPGWHPKYR
jgi:PPOX class probable F420-dependent enzyme